MFFRRNQKDFKYFIDNWSLTHVEGWAFNKKSSAAVHVEIKALDLRTVAAGETSIVRADLGGRLCGFRLPIQLDMSSLMPGRFLVFVDGVKVANCHMVVGVAGAKVIPSMDKLIEERCAALVALRTARLEREVESLSRRLAALSSKAEAGAEA